MAQQDDWPHDWKQIAKNSGIDIDDVAVDVDKLPELMRNWYLQRLVANPPVVTHTDNGDGTYTHTFTFKLIDAI